MHSDDGTGHWWYRVGPTLPGPYDVSLAVGPIKHLDTIGHRPLRCIGDQFPIPRDHPFRFGILTSRQDARMVSYLDYFHDDA